MPPGFGASIPVGQLNERTKLHGAATTSLACDYPFLRGLDLRGPAVGTREVAGIGPLGAADPRGHGTGCDPCRHAHAQGTTGPRRLTRPAPPERRGQVVGTVMSGLMLGIMLARPVASALPESVMPKVSAPVEITDVKILLIIVRSPSAHFLSSGNTVSRLRQSSFEFIASLFQSGYVFIMSGTCAGHQQGSAQP